MSNFECPVVEVKIIPHPNGDNIEIAVIGGFQSIVKKDQFRTGDLAVYIPEGAALPERLLRKLGFWNEEKSIGMLNGKEGNRVKAIKLRGTLSQGILLSPYGTTTKNIDGSSPKVELLLEHEAGDSFLYGFDLGADVAPFLNICKYEPVVPAHMAGRALGASLEVTHGYDFENIKKEPDLFMEGELVSITEKIHGTLIQICCVPLHMADEKYYRGRVVLTSKGLGKKGIILDHNDKSNVYVQACEKFGLLDKMYNTFTSADTVPEAMQIPKVLFGEVFGHGIQDLSYKQNLEFRAFDLCYGVRNEAQFVGRAKFIEFCDIFSIPRVPELYVGRFSEEIMHAFTVGMETISGLSSHMREGVVVKTARTSTDEFFEETSKLGKRLIAKSINPAYLLRKEGTEFN